MRVPTNAPFWKQFTEVRALITKRDNIHVRYNWWVAAGWQFTTLPSAEAIMRKVEELVGRVREDESYVMPWPLPQTLVYLLSSVNASKDVLVTQRLVWVPKNRVQQMRWIEPPKGLKAKSWLNKKKIKDLIKMRPELNGPGPLVNGEVVPDTEEEDALVALLTRACEDGSSKDAMEEAERALLAHVGIV